ncbi:MAG: hypothetical protein ACRD0P_17985 [Stackebrandtia sp.]
MTRHLTFDPTEAVDRPVVDDTAVDQLVPAAVRYVPATAESWPAWDGNPVLSDGNAWTPHKCLRRVADHLIDHQAEIECRLAGIPTIPDRWHGRKLTLDSDWARFTEADLDEATSRLSRLAVWYRARLSGLDAATLDHRPQAEIWTIREVAHHVANVRYYADRLDGLN